MGGWLWAWIGTEAGAEIGNVTATAVLGWYAWHTASRTIPSLLADFRGELAASRVDHRTDCDVFRAELAAERFQRHEDHERMLEALHEMTERWAATSRPSSDAHLRNDDDRNRN